MLHDSKQSVHRSIDRFSKIAAVVSGIRAYSEIVPAGLIECKIFQIYNVQHLLVFRIFSVH